MQPRGADGGGLTFFRPVHAGPNPFEPMPASRIIGIAGNGSQPDDQRPSLPRHPLYPHTVTVAQRPSPPPPPRVFKREGFRDRRGGTPRGYVHSEVTNHFAWTFNASPAEMFGMPPECLQARNQARKFHAAPETQGDERRGDWLHFFCVSNNKCAQAENPHADGWAESDAKYNN